MSGVKSPWQPRQKREGRDAVLLLLQDVREKHSNDGSRRLAGFPGNLRRLPDLFVELLVLQLQNVRQLGVRHGSSTPVIM
ncbi:MAG: hypothetical protein ABI592_04065 [Acidobacteriota bacterium]